LVKIITNSIDKKRPPKKPEYVLFGLIFVSFGPLNNFPKIYPPISVDIQIKITKRKLNKLFSSLPLSKYAEHRDKKINI
tara:strand:- start:548 stop:784 length:237 start_codon:yes stop_codon:yes gene_type:complete